RVVFSEAIAASTFTGADVLLSGPGGTVDMSQITVNSVNSQTFDVSFPARTAEGTYNVTIGPDITDLSGNPMSGDQADIYMQDFASAVGSEWSNTSEAISNGEHFLGASANGFGNGTVGLSLNNLAAHGGISVTFDLYIIQSWDGNGPAGGGADNWRL